MRSLFLALVFVTASLMSGVSSAQTELQWWHSMSGALGDRVNEIANGFNASQKEYKLVPVFKGSYPEGASA